MNNKTPFNIYFFIPFLLWCIIGGYCIVCYDSKTLFFFINQHYNPILNSLMEMFSSFGEAWAIILIGLFFMTMKAYRNIWFFSTVIFCTVIPSIVTQIIKYQVAAPRPMTVFAQESWVHILGNWPLLHNNSFPSGHTTGAFGLFTFLACALPLAYRPIGFLFFCVALATGYARVYLAAHFFLDIYFGSIIGVVFSFLVFHLLNYLKFRYQQRLQV